MTLLLSALACAVLFMSVLITKAVRRYALRRNMIDVPNARSSHSVPVPRGGGLAIVIAFFLSLIALTICGELPVKTTAVLLSSSMLVAAVGFLDDRRSLSPLARMCAQLLSATLLVAAVGGILQDDLARWVMRGNIASFGIALLAVAWTTNLFNFMDGIDGIAASEAVFVAVGLAILNSLSGGDVGITSALVCLSVSTAGFLVWNWPPAKIFMGDVGSGFLGFTLAAFGLMVHRNGRVPFEVVGILGGVFFTDATVTVVRRWLRRERLSEAHRTHAYQHLAARWGSHLSVTLVVWALNLCWLFPWALLAVERPELTGIAFAAALIPLGIVAVVLGAGRAK